MNYTETIEFLYSQLPMFSRIGKAAYKKDLTNTLLLCQLLGHPEKKFKSIHIAGTNGKGSTSHALAAILHQSGYKTGLYTSPHLKDFRERIRINGRMIPEEYVIRFVEKYKTEVLKIGCSFFEWSVGLAFDYFAKEQVDIAVIETGLGGRLDSTNVIVPVLSIITNISLDHTDMLGDTVVKIAEEKAGIIKADMPVVIGESDSGGEVTEVLLRAANEKKSPVYVADEFFRISDSELGIQHSKFRIEDRNGKQYSILCDLTGSYQEKNLLTVLQSVMVLRQDGLNISDDSVFVALSRIKNLTGLRGRWDILSERPLIIADVAHNEAGLKYAVEQLKTYSFNQLHFVIGFVKEKELSKILKLFPKDAMYYFCRPDIPRGLDVDVLKKSALENGLNGKTYASVIAAYEAAKQNASVHDLIYVGGSTFVVAEVI